MAIRNIIQSIVDDVEVKPMINVVTVYTVGRLSQNNEFNSTCTCIFLQIIIYDNKKNTKLKTTDTGCVFTYIRQKI